VQVGRILLGISENDLSTGEDKRGNVLITLNEGRGAKLIEESEQNGEFWGYG